MANLSAIPTHLSFNNESNLYSKQGWTLVTRRKCHKKQVPRPQIKPS